MDLSERHTHKNRMTPTTTAITIMTLSIRHPSRRPEWTMPAVR
jgi:hypothetical protein